VSEVKIVGISIVFSILLIGFTILVMNFIYPEWGTEIDTDGMSAEQIELVRKWME
jgi:Na+/H+-dicarboxylate symporter